MSHTIRNAVMELTVDDHGLRTLLTDLSTGSRWILDPESEKSDPSGECQVYFGDQKKPKRFGENAINEKLGPARTIVKGRAVPESDRSVIVTREGEGGAYALRYELCAEGLRISLLPGLSTATACTLPGAFHPEGLEAFPVVLPKNQGVWHKGTGLPFSFTLLRNGHSGWTMPFFAAMGPKTALLTIMEDEHDASIHFEKRETGAVRIYAVMNPAMGKLTYERRVLLKFVPPDLTSICAQYRKYLLDRSRITFWEEKIADRPAVEKLFGALNCFIGYCQDPDLDYAASFRALKRMGFERALAYPLCIGNYLEGFLMGGRPPIDIRRHLPLLDELGYLAAGWMWVEDLPVSAKKPENLMLDRNGSTLHSWQIDDLEWLRACPSSQVAASNRIQNERMRGFTAHHFDVTACRAGLECFHPDHPLDKRQDAEWRRKTLESAARRGLPVSSEGFWGYATGSYDLGSVKIPLTVHNDWYTVPITSLVYHDSCIHDWWEVDNYNNPHHRNQGDRDKTYFPVPGGGWQSQQAAVDALGGSPPNVMPFGAQYAYVGGRSGGKSEPYGYTLDSPEVREALALALPVARLHRRIGKLACVGHETLRPDGSLQATVFKDGTRVIANFADQAQELPVGGVLEPYAWKAT